jgi:hypothetical protein
MPNAARDHSPLGATAEPKGLWTDRERRPGLLGHCRRRAGADRSVGGGEEVEMRDRGWEELLIGGACGVGKTQVSYR